jgi:hypothetical protein
MSAAPESEMRSTLAAFVGYALLFGAAVAMVMLTHSQPPGSDERESVTPAGEEATTPPATTTPVPASGPALRRQPLLA